MSLFANAQKIEAPKTAAKKPKAPQHEIKGLEQLAAIDAAIKALTGLREGFEATVKVEMASYFVAEGTKVKARPVNFQGLDGDAKASCQLRARSATSKLTVDDVALLTDHNIPFLVETMTPEAFLINPSYTNDMELLARVEEALANVDLPDDFLMKQEKVTRTVATEASLDAIFTHDSKVAATLLPVVSTLAIRPSIPDDKFWAKLDEIMNPVEKDEIAKA